jgi:hypothetical protein
MLIETATALKIWKWVFISIDLFLATAAVIVTSVVLPLGLDGIWLPIFTACIAAVCAAILAVYDKMDFNGWINDCKQSAGEYIIQGRNIESVKRVPRVDRDRPGLVYANDASIVFETIRANQPPILNHVKRRHPAPNYRSTISIPTALLQEQPEDDGKAEDKMERGEAQAQGEDGQSNVHTDEKVSLQDLFKARLAHMQQEKAADDELARYEDYIRSQFRANDALSPRCHTAAQRAQGAAQASQAPAVSEEIPLRRRKTSALRKTSVFVNAISSL